MNRTSASKLAMIICLVAPLLLQVNCGGGGGGGDDDLTTSLSGRIVAADGNDLSGIYVEATGYVPAESGCSSRPVIQGTVTDNKGSYTFVTQEAGDSGGEVRIEPASPNYVFEPQFANLYLNYGEHRGGVDFTGYRLFNLSGSLLGPTLDELAGTTILVEGGGLKASTQVASTGEYSLFRLREGEYMVTPSNPYLTFEPPQRLVSSSGTDLFDINFTAQPMTFTISGTIVHTLQDRGLPEVRVVLSGGTSQTETIADQNGVYHFPSLVHGEYQVTPYLPGYDFSPKSQTVWLDVSDQSVIDFSADYTVHALSGQIRDVTGAPLSRIAISMDGISSLTVRTGDDGSYQIPGLILGDYQLTPATVCPAFYFSPPYRVFGVSGGPIPDQNFTAIRTDVGAYEISGRVIDKAENGLPGISVELDGITQMATTSDEFGNFQFPGLLSGSYTVTVDATAYNLDPLRREINLCSMDDTDIDFREIATWTSSGYLAARGIAVHRTSEGDYVIALDGSDIRVIKVNDQGVPLWLKAYQGEQDEMATAITGLIAGGSLVAGRIQSPAATTRDGLLMKLGETGDIVWAKIFHDTRALMIRSVAEMNDGGYLVAGVLGTNQNTGAGIFIKTDAEGSIIWQSEWPDLTVIHTLLTADGGIVAVGGKLVLALSPLGDVLWVKRYEFGEWQVSLEKIIPSGPDNYYVAGTIRNSVVFPEDSDHFAMRIGATGELLWSRRIGNPTPIYASYAYERFNDAQPSPSGGLLYVGVRSYDQNNSGARILELNDQGDLLWFRDKGNLNISHIIQSLVRADGDRFLGAGYYGWSTLTSAFALELTKLDAGEDTCNRYGTYPLNVNQLAGIPVAQTMAPPVPGQVVASAVALTTSELTVGIPSKRVCSGVEIFEGDL